MVLVCIVASMPGYVLAKKRFPGRTLLFSLLIGAMALPKQVILIPLVRMMNTMGLYDTLWSVILPSVGWPFGIFLMKQFAEGIPGEMMEAARIDGAGEFRTFNSIVLPIMKPAMATQAIFTYVTSWNNLFIPMILLTKKENYTMPIMVSLLKGDIYKTEYGAVYLALAMSVLPLFIVYFLLSKYIIAGVALGSVKE